MKRITALAVALIISLQMAGCGLILYPERQGQTGGRIDPGVAILDAAGLLVFVVPGLVAFGVDFITGTIYLPGGSGAASEADGVREVMVADAALDASGIERVVAMETGYAVDLDAPQTQVAEVSSKARLIEAVNRPL